jgi:putative acetyltransferase
MMEDIEIRESAAGDRAAIEALYPEAFPQEDLLPLVAALLREGHGVLSLVAQRGRSLLGHGAFTMCRVEGSNARAVLLGPLAVAAAAQQRGVGSAIVRAGLERLKREGVAWVFVLGDPAYYRRFGFAPENLVAPPYALPEEWRDAWQSVSLGGGRPLAGGKLSVPTVWRKPALWGP